MCQSRKLDAGSDLTENDSFASSPSFNFYLCSSLAIHCISKPNRLCWYKDGRNENRSMFLVVVRNAFSSICASLCLLKVLMNNLANYPGNFIWNLASAVTLFFYKYSVIFWSKNVQIIKITKLIKNYWYIATTYIACVLIYSKIQRK